MKNIKQEKIIDKISFNKNIQLNIVLNNNNNNKKKYIKNIIKCRKYFSKICHVKKIRRIWM